MQKRKKTKTQTKERECMTPLSQSGPGELCVSEKEQEKGRERKKNAAHFLLQTDNEPLRANTRPPVDWTRLLSITPDP